ncbi:alkaline phosphatase D family protein [Neiella marina]|uniref:Alkaline phosphatase D family protein n=1 Tax=Neiella holothuriorum TaxID=2870530 RepID=A0ABS7EJ34_9GAMM|nr:alkaline phosphatase D family protein [Neiella holothuriorum]MBW8192230.1 alkaline phosphatase D family protein [Neiella holothuriorum]
MKKAWTRREFLVMSAIGAGSAVLSVGLSGCGSDNDGIRGAFNHGVASGDPAANAVILWTRVTPEKDGDVVVSWQVAEDDAFNQIVIDGSTTTTVERDYTVKVDAAGLSAGTTYYYRFKVRGLYSPVGQTKTLPVGVVEQVRFATVSCSNFPAGYFHVYGEIATRNDLDAVIHLGDYIYEYGADGYASDYAEAMDRVVQPTTELYQLSDYRQRYAQYRTDTNCQAAHAAHPFIVVWDDHEIANDIWRDGAENHDNTEGDFDERKLAALQAFFEWLPIRPVGNMAFDENIYRTFDYGELVVLHMLDTRVVGRDQQLDYADYIDSATGAIDADGFTAAVSDSNRTLLGATQLSWLQGQLTTSTAQWQVLGQQVLMGRMLLPAAIATQQLSIEQYAELGALAVLAQRAAAGDPTLTADELAYLSANADRLTADVQALLQLPSIPYNLDAWDGYAYEREVVLGTAMANQANLVVLSGDTHNAWANQLTDASGNVAGVEFATTSVSSPGMEEYLNIADDAAPATEAGLVQLVDGLKYCNINQRGYMVATFTESGASAEWTFVNSVKSTDYQVVAERAASMSATAGTATLG